MVYPTLLAAIGDVAHPSLAGVVPTWADGPVRAARWVDGKYVRTTRQPSVEVRCMKILGPSWNSPSTGPEKAELPGPRTWATPLVAAVLIVCWASSVAVGVDAFAPSGKELLRAGASWGPGLLAGEWWRLASATVLHAGIVHLAFNLWALWDAGRSAERNFGVAAFAMIYVASALGGSLTSVAAKPLSISVGASGAIFGVYGALLAAVLRGEAGALQGTLRQQRNSLLGFLGYNLVFGVVDPSIDVAGHLGGLVTGAAVSWLLCGVPAASAPRRRAPVVMGLVVTFVAAAWGVRARVAAVPEVRADIALERAAEAAKAKDWATARRLYDEVLAIRREPSWLKVRALVAAQQEDGATAVADLRESLALAPSPEKQVELCATIAWVGGAREVAGESAVAECDRAVETSPTSARALEGRAALLWSSEPEKALRDLNRAIELAPADQSTRMLRLRLLRRLGHLDEAELECDGYWRGQTLPPSVLGTCVDVDLLRGNAAGALQRLEQPLSVAPHDPRLLGLRSRAREASGDLDGALEDLDDLLGLNWSDARALNQRGWIRVQRGDDSGGLADAEASLAIRPDSAATLGTRCFALAGLGRLGEARDDCARATALDPGDLVDRGMLALLAGRRNEALALWREAARKDPTIPRQVERWGRVSRERAR
jgi:rhomboid protease GluP